MTQSRRPVGPGDHVFLVDGSSFVFRAYFQSIRQDQKYNYRADRLPVGAVRLFATKLLQFIRDGAAGIKPTHLAIIFDKSENSFRRELYPAYKSHRPDPPEDLVPQFPLMRDTVRAFGLAPIEQDRYEADDLIATYAKQASERGADVLIVSADKDLMQLVGPRVAMYDPASGDREERRIGPNEVAAYFGGGADKVIDIQALAGDSTDNVPGVPGIGVKTAAQLIAEFGDLETLLSRTAEIKQPKRREALEANADNARLSKKLVTLDRNVALDVPIEQLAVRDRDGPMLIAFCKAMEFTALTRRVAEATKTDIDSVEPGMPGDPPPAKAKPKSDKADVTEEAVPARPVYRPYFNSGEKRGPNGDAAAASGPGKRAAEAAAAMAAKPFDLKSYETISTVDQLDRWIAE